ncbi:MAG: exodeoxyribonuclease I [Legionellales bacterium]|nr:exodeoxyribonuclease I [Legionellales bacterium]
MTTKTFLFYDIETSGLNKAFDQVLEFAAIRTDAALNPIETHECLVQVSRDTLPDPHAVLVHHLTPQACANGQVESDAIRFIHRLMNQPGTISLGYNTLGFDDEFLRFSFFRHLLTPYTHQYAQGCGRADLYPMVLMYYLFRPNQLKWPRTEQGVSMKLEALNSENQLASGRAHTALADVEATLALAQKLYQDQAMWSYLLGYFDKQTALKRLSDLPQVEGFSKGQVGVCVEGALGALNQFHAPVLILGMHQVYRNQCVMLRLDRKRLSTLDYTDLNEIQACMLRKKISESIVAPLNRFESYWDDERRQLIQDNLKWCAQAIAPIQSIAEYCTGLTYPNVPDCDASAALYQVDFPDQALILQYHEFWKYSFSEASVLISGFPEHARQCAERLLWRRPEALETGWSSPTLNQYLAGLKGHASNERVDYTGRIARTAQMVRTQIQTCYDQSSKEQQRLLDQLSDWLKVTWAV